MKNKTEKISCIIPAYNEAGRIGAVLDAARNHPMINEVILIDDGSTDRTKETIEQKLGEKVKLISFEKNMGKSFAVAAGIEKAVNDIIFLLDGDLMGLTEKDISNIIHPILSGEADMSISLRKNSLLIYKLFKLDYVSGERVFQKSLIMEHLAEIRRLPGFGLESFINELIIKNSWRVKVVYWRDVITPRKSKKIGFFKGRKKDLSMIIQILSVTSPREIIRIYFKMIKLRST
jgi:glycosyltransferase involved in cell wall biosynthesis